MFIIWYTLFSVLYLFTTIFYIFFCKLLKLDKSIFTFVFNKLDEFFNFYNTISLLLKNTKENNLSNRNTNINFKDIYNEVTFYSNKDIKLNINRNTFDTSSIFCLLNNKLLTSLAVYSYSLNYFISLTPYHKSTNIKKVNLSYFSNKVSLLNTKFNVFSEIKSTKSYLIYKKKLFTNSKISVTISEKFNTAVNKTWLIKFSPSNFIKYIDYLNINTYNILYLRKAKVFNKGRYSRNRQYYRTGVYWCLYVNIIAVVGIYFWFYRFTMNFGYLWWLLFAFIASFIVPKAVKYRLYNPKNLVNSITDDLIWLGVLVLNIKYIFTNFFSKILLLLNNYYLNSQFFNLNKTNNIIKNTISSYFSMINFISLSGNNSLINNVIYKWEFSNTNYYYNSIIQSKPIILEKVKQYWLGLVSIIFFTK